MQALLYAPYVYAVALIVIGFIAARREEKNIYFWSALGIAELSRLGQMLFLVQNFGHPIYALTPQGSSSSLHYLGLDIAGAAALIGVFGGIALHWRYEKRFPSMWIALLSGVELIIVGILRLSL